MALNENYSNYSGQQSGNNGNKKVPTVYSPYRFVNAMSSVDPGVLGFSFWQRSLKVTISPRKPGSPDERPEYDYDNNIFIFLNHTKAYVLYNEIVKFQQDPVAFNNVGVPSGSSVITINNGNEFGLNSPCLVITKTDENGNVVNQLVYQFKNDYYYAIRNYDAKQKSFDKVTADYQDVEIEMFKTLLLEYYKAMTGAIAYSVIDQMQYNQARTDMKIDQICQKLGVNFSNNRNGGGRNYGSSYFNQSAATNYNSTSLDDIDVDIE